VWRIVSSLGFEHLRFFSRSAEFLVDLIEHTVKALVVLSTIGAALGGLFSLSAAIDFTGGPVRELMADQRLLQIGTVSISPVPD